MVYWASQGKHMFDGLAGKHHPAIIQREAGMWRERAAQAEQQAQSAATARAPHRRRTTRKQPEPLTLTLDEARGLALLAQGLEQVAGATDFSPSFPIRARGIQARDTISDAPAQVRGRPPDATTAVPSCVPADQPITLADLSALIERLGVVQVDTISVVERSQYLVLWSRLGAYENRLLDQLLRRTYGLGRIALRVGIGHLQAMPVDAAGGVDLRDREVRADVHLRAFDRKRRFVTGTRSGAARSRQLASFGSDGHAHRVRAPIGTCHEANSRIVKRGDNAAKVVRRDPHDAVADEEQLVAGGSGKAVQVADLAVLGELLLRFFFRSVALDIAVFLPARKENPKHIKQHGEQSKPGVQNPVFERRLGTGVLLLSQHGDLYRRFAITKYFDGKIS